MGNFVSTLVARTLVTTDSSNFSMEDCKVKEMVGNRGEEALRVELQLKEIWPCSNLSVMGCNDC